MGHKILHNKSLEISRGPSETIDFKLQSVRLMHYLVIEIDLGSVEKREWGHLSNCAKVNL